jgi:L-lactate utilization protein LutB
VDFDAHSLRAKKAVLDNRLQERLTNMRSEWSKREAERERLLEQSQHLIEDVKDIRLKTIDNIDKRVLSALEYFESTGLRSFMASTPKELAEYMRDHVGNSGIAIVPSPELTEAKIVQAFGMSNKIHSISLENRLCEEQGLPPLHPLFPTSLVLDDETISKTKDKISSEFERAEITIVSIHGVSLDGAIYLDSSTLELLNQKNSSKKKTFFVVTVDRIYPKESEMRDVLKLREIASGFISKSVKLEQLPKETHLILFDNGRIALSRSAMREMLVCISCSSCSLFCPVFHSVGYNYGSPFMAGIGNFMTSRSDGIKNSISRGLYMCLLCGSCKEHCPLGLDIPKGVMETRRRANISKL